MRRASERLATSDRVNVIVECENCGSQVNIWREPVVQEDRAADQYGPAVHVILGDGWVLHHCTVEDKRHPD